MTDSSAARPLTVPRSTWLALSVLLLGVAMALLDTTIVNVALPTIRTSLDASEATLSWIVSGYALAYGLALIPSGRLGDRFGHSRMFIIGLTGFTLASLWCGLAGGPTELIVARIVQGASGGVFFPAVTALIQLMFPALVRGKAFAVMGATIGFSTALGPIVGGLLIEAFGVEEGWRSIFFVNLPFGVIAVIAAVRLLPRIVEGRGSTGVDGLGLLLLSASLVALLVPLIQGEDAGWPLWTWASIVGSLVLLALFALWEVAVVRRGRSPLVPPHLFTHGQFTGGVLLAMVYFAAFTSIFFTISIMWQSGLGHSALSSGLVSVPFAAGSIIGAPLSDRLARKLGRTVLAIGAGLVATGLVAVWVLLVTVPGQDLTHLVLAGPLLLAGMGSGIFIAPNTQFIVATVERSEAGAASGVVGVAQRIGSAAGIAVIGAVLFGALDFPPGRPTPDVVAEVFTTAASHAMAVSAGLAILAFALVFALPKRITH
ncbi:major facilitator superfamily MFS_1 [Xylanimonas cellulosilytica DSM 15894]|uniref:Major facilitator superfamily MFS_1 n=1 Tax=Xylanimonas cellulosilytica (strain DSM 15894 / JCM 12276 / CECT 5975 / KCTC 9989 / LMG 20990 / NBRC 107835 / XIL07) TaxID=446471 RepID=D1BUH1_XYLCX|nr:MFS transporter [Xylanimonas cellulosilytica]ACZ31184.1 major facilitator superfamily MFS_1 [Xylanimonas cellulosilytica DSM 15894]